MSSVISETKRLLESFGQGTITVHFKIIELHDITLDST